MNTANSQTDIIEVILVEADACHLCEDAKSVLEAASAEHRLRLRRVDLASVEGRAILRSTRASMPPIVIIDGELIGWGRLSRGKLRRRLEALEHSGSQ